MSQEGEKKLKENKCGKRVDWKKAEKKMNNRNESLVSINQPSGSSCLLFFAIVTFPLDINYPCRGSGNTITIKRGARDNDGVSIIPGTLRAFPLAR